MSQLSEEDKSLFASAMQDVTPLSEDEKISSDRVEQQRKKQKKVVRKVIRKQKNRDIEMPLIESYEAVEGVSAFESLLFHRKGLRLQDLARLKKGELTIESQLDLHGMTEEAADLALQQFIHRSAHQGNRCIMVIHGKGYNSETGQPVLKNLVNRRLRQLKSVLAFCSTQPKDGGTGSVYVLLRSKKPEDA